MAVLQVVEVHSMDPSGNSDIISLSKRYMELEREETGWFYVSIEVVRKMINMD